ncbi:MAG: hypothetical protein DRP75_03295 [Candidatus Omnitrophota bacterium]|nr:MAG: hypothetical protein DRP75_03295 [Candidatus Omnitrophota bacterium]
MRKLVILLGLILLSQKDVAFASGHRQRIVEFSHQKSQEAFKRELPLAAAEGYQSSPSMIISVENFEEGVLGNSQGADASGITSEEAHNGRFSLKLVNTGTGKWASYGIVQPFQDVPKDVNLKEYNLCFYAKSAGEGGKGIVVTFVDGSLQYDIPAGRHDFILSNDWEKYRIDLDQVSAQGVDINNITQMSLHHGDEVWASPLVNPRTPAFIDDILLIHKSVEEEPQKEEKGLWESFIEWLRGLWPF